MMATYTIIPARDKSFKVNEYGDVNRVRSYDWSCDTCELGGTVRIPLGAGDPRQVLVSRLLDHLDSSAHKIATERG